MIYNWNTDTTELKKDKRAFEIWEMEQKINYGLRGGKISRKKLMEYWEELDIDPLKRRFYRFLLWGKLS